MGTLLRSILRRSHPGEPSRLRLFDASGWLGTDHVAAAGSCDAGERDGIEASMDLGVVVGGGIAVGVTERAGVSIDLLYTVRLIPVGG